VLANLPGMTAAMADRVVQVREARAVRIHRRAERVRRPTTDCHRPAYRIPVLRARRGRQRSHFVTVVTPAGPDDPAVTAACRGLLTPDGVRKAGDMKQVRGRPCDQRGRRAADQHVPGDAGA
jgi:hypothetical protein